MADPGEAGVRPVLYQREQTDSPVGQQGTPGGYGIVFVVLSIIHKP